MRLVSGCSTRRTSLAAAASSNWSHTPPVANRTGRITGSPVDKCRQETSPLDRKGPHDRNSLDSRPQSHQSRR